MNCQLYSGWREGKRKPGIGPCGEGLVEAAGESIEVWGVRAGGGVGVSDGERYGTPVIDLGKETFGEKAVGVCEGGGNDVRESSFDAGSERVGRRGVSDGVEPTGRVGERGGFCSPVFLSGYFVGRGLLAFALWGGPGGAGRLSVGGEVFGSELGVEGGRGKG